jgi:hypothetical protein
MLIAFILAYPESLLVYNAGVPRTVFVGCLKVTTIFLFSFSCLVIAPAYYYAPTEPNWMAVAGTLRSCPFKIAHGDTLC